MSQSFVRARESMGRDEGDSAEGGWGMLAKAEKIASMSFQG